MSRHNLEDARRAVQQSDRHGLETLHIRSALRALIQEVEELRTQINKLRDHLGLNGV